MPDDPKQPDYAQLLDGFKQPESGPVNLTMQQPSEAEIGDLKFWPSARASEQPPQTQEAGEALAGAGVERFEEHPSGQEPLEPAEPHRHADFYYKLFGQVSASPEAGETPSTASPAPDIEQPAPKNDLTPEP